MDMPVTNQVVYQRETWTEALRDEVWPLLQRHWEEVALDQETVPLDPLWDLYDALEQKGSMIGTTARLNGELVGYCVHFIIPNLHYRSLKVADNDIFWLAPEHRNSRIGINLLRAAEQFAREAGCNKILMKEKLHIPLGRLFEFLGYREIERLHAKTLIGAS